MDTIQGFILQSYDKKKTNTQMKKKYFILKKTLKLLTEQKFEAKRGAMSSHYNPKSIRYSMVIFDTK